MDVFGMGGLDEGVDGLVDNANIPMVSPEKGFNQARDLVDSG